MRDCGYRITGSGMTLNTWPKEKPHGFSTIQKVPGHPPAGASFHIMAYTKIPMLAPGFQLSGTRTLGKSWTCVSVGVKERKLTPTGWLYFGREGERCCLPAPMAFPVSLE